MSAKRIAAHTVDWAAFSQRVPKSQVAQFRQFKEKSDGYVRQ